MEKRAIVLALALVLPLALYGIPYAAASTTSSYVAYTSFTASGPGYGSGTASCNAGDYATGGGYGEVGGDSYVNDFYPTTGTSDIPTPTGSTPNGYFLQVYTSAAGLIEFQVWAVCQTPITIAGLGVPQFGSLYIAIVLGALVYFALSRHYARKPSALTSTASRV